MIEICLGAAVIFFAVYFWLFRWDPLGAIPGPKLVPIFGNVLQLVNKVPHLQFNDWSKTYGAIFRMYFFKTPILIISGPEFINKVLVKEAGEFTGRPYMYRLEVLTDNFSGVIATDAGPEVKARRKLMQTYLRQFGTGMKRIEDVTMAAADDLMQRIAQQNGRPICVRDHLYDTITDVMGILVYGDTVSPEDAKKIRHSLFDFIEIMERNLHGELLDRFPWLRYFGVAIYKRLLELEQTKRDTIGRWFADEPENGFINFIQTLSDEQKRDFEIPEEKHEITVMWEFFNAGVITTSNNLTMLVHVLAQMPTVQKKLRQEILDKVGSARAPSLEDRDNMPYHRAALLEIGRFASIVPMGVPHKAVRDTQLGQYPIPGGTYIMVNLWGLHHDSDLWEDPFTFKPERFLDPSGEVVPADHPNRKNLLPFGAGPRVCVGEVFALSRMFLILSRLVQNFEILPESSVENQPSMDPRDMKDGIILLPPQFKVRLDPVS